MSKAYLTISNIGVSRFWMGVFAGLFTAIALVFFFSYSREIFRFVSQGPADLIILSPEDHWFFNYFFSALSVTLGLSISVWIWLGNRIHKRKTDKRYKTYAMTLILVNFWIILMGVSRIGSLLPLILHSLTGYDNHLDFAVEFKWLFIALPIVIFLLTWSSTRIIYKSLKWIGLSIPICVLSIISFAHLTDIDTTFINNGYYFQHEVRLSYVDSEIVKATNNYNLHFEEQAIISLQKWSTESSFEQIKDIQTAFRGDLQISLDTIIMSKIILHNMKIGYWKWHGLDAIENWQYPRPIQVLNQINKNEIDSDETKELVEILKEQIRMWNCDDIDHSDYNKLSEYEHERLYFAEMRFPRLIVEQLKMVRDSLMSDVYFVENFGMLPEVIEIKQ